MTEKQHDPPWFDEIKFDEGQKNFPYEELQKYAGMYVAFSMDGTRIVAWGKTGEELGENLKAAGIPFNQVVEEHVLPSGTLVLGGLALFPQTDPDAPAGPDPGRAVGTPSAPGPRHGGGANQ